MLIALISTWRKLHSKIAATPMPAILLYGIYEPSMHVSLGLVSFSMEHTIHSSMTFFSGHLEACSVFLWDRVPSLMMFSISLSNSSKGSSSSNFSWKRRICWETASAWDSRAVNLKRIVSNLAKVATFQKKNRTGPNLYLETSSTQVMYHLEIDLEIDYLHTVASSKNSLSLTFFFAS